MSILDCSPEWNPPAPPRRRQGRFGWGGPGGLQIGQFHGRAASRIGRGGPVDRGKWGPKSGHGNSSTGFTKKNSSRGVTSYQEALAKADLARQNANQWQRMADVPEETVEASWVDLPSEAENRPLRDARRIGPDCPWNSVEQDRRRLCGSATTGRGEKGWRHNLARYKGLRPVWMPVTNVNRVGDPQMRQGKSAAKKLEPSVGFELSCSTIFVADAWQRRQILSRRR